MLCDTDREPRRSCSRAAELWSGCRFGPGPPPPPVHWSPTARNRAVRGEGGSCHMLLWFFSLGNLLPEMHSYFKENGIPVGI